jgi:hypothetical protein
MWRIVLGIGLGLGVGPAAVACDGVCGIPVVRGDCGCAPVVVCPPCPCAPARVVAPMPRPATPFARPTPAPPSTTEPPLASPPSTPAPMPPVAPSPEPPPATLSGPAPASPASRPASPGYDLYRVPARSASAKAGPRARVTFWNLSGRDRVLKVGGRTQPLPNGRRVVLELERSFEWQIDGRQGSEKATVRAEDVGLEVVVRR